MKSDGKGVNNYGGGHSEGGGGNNGETGENEEQEVYQEEERQDCENQLKGETTEGKEQVGRKKNRWLISFVKLSQKIAGWSNFHIFTVKLRWLATVRRHSMAISGITAFQSSKRRPSSSTETAGNRRTSIQGGLSSLSKQMTLGLGLGPAGGQNALVLKGCTVSKTAMQDSLKKCLRQPDLRVVGLESHQEGDGRRGQVEVVVKWPEGRKRMMLEVNRVGRGDHQAEVLLGPVSKICQYLEKVLKAHLTPQFIPLPNFFNIDPPELEEEDEAGEKSKLEKRPGTVLVVEAPGPAGILSLSHGALADYEHSALTITTIARSLGALAFSVYLVILSHNNP